MGTDLSISEATKLMANRAGKSMAEICRKIDLGTPSNLTQMVNNESIKTRVSAAVAEACGYKMRFVNDETGDVIEVKGEI